MTKGGDVDIVSVDGVETDEEELVIAAELGDGDIPFILSSLETYRNWPSEFLIGEESIPLDKRMRMAWSIAESVVDHWDYVLEYQNAPASLLGSIARALKGKEVNPEELKPSNYQLLRKEYTPSIHEHSYWKAMVCLSDAVRWLASATKIYTGITIVKPQDPESLINGSLRGVIQSVYNVEYHMAGDPRIPFDSAVGPSKLLPEAQEKSNAAEKEKIKQVRYIVGQLENSDWQKSVRKELGY